MEVRRGGFVIDERNRRRGSPHNVLEDGLTQVERVRPAHGDDVELRVYNGVGQDQLVANVRDTNTASSDSGQTEVRPELCRQTNLIKRVGQIKHFAEKGFALLHFEASKHVDLPTAVEHQSLEAGLL